MTEIKEKIKKKSNKKLIVIVAAIILILTLSVGGVVIYNNLADSQPTPSNGVVGKISDDWDTGIEEETSPKKTGIQIPGYSTAEMKSNDTSLNISIGNPKSNTCGFYATVKLDDGTELYKSNFLKPGSGLTSIPVSQKLNKGEYKAVVYYECVTLDEPHTPLNSAESEFTLVVK